MLHCWRHPRPEGAKGLCVGARSDLPVHWRRAKRLARRIEAVARRERLPRAAVCSPLARCADVGAWLARRGWRVTQDPTLVELDFGAWDGRLWSAIPRAEVDAWVADFAAYRPGDGESLVDMLERAARWEPPGNCAIVIGHGGWMLARRWLAARGQILPRAAEWPAPPRYGERWRI